MTRRFSRAVAALISPFLVFLPVSLAAAAPRPGLAVAAPDLSAYDCAAAASATVHMGQVISGHYYEWTESYQVSGANKKLTCISMIVPQAEQLDAASAKSFIARSSAIGAPAEAARVASSAATAPALEPPDIKPEPAKHLKPLAPGRSKTSAPAPATHASSAPTASVAPAAATGSTPSAPANAATTDPRTLVSGSTALSFPWNTVGYLSVTYPDGESFRCSGTVVSAYVVLTAGHCIHNNTRGGYVSQVRFYPGQGASAFGSATSPYGVATNWSNLQTTQTWTQISGPDSFDVVDYSSDIAAIQFRTPFTYTSTFMPVQYSSTDANVTNGGYPADIIGSSATAYGLYTASGGETSDSTGYYEFYNVREFSIYSSGGDSGSAFWTTDSTGRASMVGTLSYGDSSPDISGGPWYNYWNYPLLSNWVAWTPGTPSISSLLSDGMHVSAVFSSTQGSGEFFLRFYNNGSSAGAVTVILENSVTGAQLATWTSPSIPVGAEAQFALDAIESQASSSFTKPPFYSLTIKPGIIGFFQHVVYHPADGTLTNLSTCDSGSVNVPYLLLAVHSSLLANGYPSTVVVYNTGTAATTVQLAVFDARNGNQIGTYTTPSIPAQGQAMVSVPTIEAALKISPAAGEYHYVVEAISNFNGYVQNLVDNQKAGIFADMTTVCILPPA